MARLGASLAALTSASLGGADVAAAASLRSAPWQPARHPQDDWFEELPGKHRFFFDATSAVGAGESIAFASNFLVASAKGYQLGESENAIVIGLRHHATLFAFSDAIWQKYGVPLSERISYVDPRTRQPPVVNIYQAIGYGALLPNRETTLNAMAKRGVHFALCDMATQVYAGVAAGKLGLKASDVYEELRASALPNAHFVAAGIVAVNRAQERGYTIQHIG